MENVLSSKKYYFRSFTVKFVLQKTSLRNVATVKISGLRGL